MIRLYPFENTVDTILQGTDDWSRYARFALDIVDNGILMPSLEECYWSPASFLYNYFVAFCFYAFGKP